MKNKNKGFEYEDKILSILKERKIIDSNTISAKGSDKADILILLNDKKINIELKNKSTSADYGQKELKWNKKNSWHWSLGKKGIKDSTVKQYEAMNIIDNYIDKNFIPKKYSKIISNEDKIKSIYEKVTIEDYLYDKDQIERKNISIPLDTLFQYYKDKNTFYIQIENSGFYHLSEDIFMLGTNQFDGEIKLRLRAKYRQSKKKMITEPWTYGFLGKIQLVKKPSKSPYDIEKREGAKFPFKDLKKVD